MQMALLQKMFMEFKKSHPDLEKDIKGFVARVSSSGPLRSRDASPVGAWNSMLIKSLRGHALAELEPGKCEISTMVTRWIFEELGSSDYTQTNTVRLLIRTGHFRFHENVDLLRSRFCPYDEEEVRVHIHDIAKRGDIDVAIRQDFTGGVGYAIDPENSFELDDAVTAVELPDGRFQVWIHIADPTSFVSLNSPLDIEARSRGQTVYLPDCTSFMFPKLLALDMMSFRRGESCRALTISVTLNKDGSFDTGGYNLSVTTVKVESLTYREADAILVNRVDDKVGTDLRILLAASNARAAWRRMHKSEANYGGVCEPGMRPGTAFKRIEMKVQNTDAEPIIEVSCKGDSVTKSPSHLIVDELMVLGGHIMACLARDNKIPVPFRGRGYYDYVQRPRLDLGLDDGYVQCTSPIRRYMDCVTHYQMKRYIYKAPPLSRKYIEKIGRDADCEDDANILISRTKRYWVIELFRIAKLGGYTFSATVVKSEMYRPRDGFKKQWAKVKVRYDEVVQYDTKVEDIPLIVDVSEGAVITVEVVEADPRTFCLSFKYYH